MDHIRSPSELLYGLKYTAGEEDGSLSVVGEEFAVLILVYAFAVEIVLIVNEVYLHSGCGYGCDLDYERPVDIADDDVHA